MIAQLEGVVLLAQYTQHRSRPQEMDRRVIIVLVAACTVALEISVSRAICSSNFLPRTFELGPFLPGVGQLSHPGEILATSYNFTCQGNVTHWEAYTSGDGGHLIEFQVWRNLPTLLRYQLVGINIFPNATPTGGVLSLSVPMEEQIQVSPGDFIGIRTTQGTEENGFQILKPSVNLDIDYSLTMAGYMETPDELRVGRSGSLVELAPGGLRRLTITPLINAVVAGDSMPLTTEPMTTTDSNTSPPSTLPQSTVIAIAVAAGLLLALVTLFIITLILVCYCMRKSKNPPSSREQIQLSDNTAYNNAPVESQNRQFELTNNTAYADRTGESDDEPYYSRIRDD